MQFDIPQHEKSIIKVIGVGGGGSNAVTHMYNQGIVGVDFAISNTDSQAMAVSPVPVKIQLGPHLTEGRGAGSKPQVGKQACIESIEEVRKFLEENTKMLFITAGMGGGTGTGAAPIIAKVAKEMDVLTVAIVTLPFRFEGRRRHIQAHEGLEDLKKNVDAIIIISNDKLKEMYGNLAASEAFSHADNVLTTAAKGIAEIITVAGQINVDFEDVNTVMRDSGIAIMGTGIADGERRAQEAIHQALNSPLLEDNDIGGAKHILLNISSGSKEITMDEIYQITEYVQEESGVDTDLIWGNCYDEDLGNKISVTVIATGFDDRKGYQKIDQQGVSHVEKIIVPLDDINEIAKKEGIYDTGSSSTSLQTFELEIDHPAEKYSIQHRANGDPYFKESEEQPDMKENKKAVAQSHHKPPPHKAPKLVNPQTIIDMENEPAYVRRKVQLEDVPHSSEVTTSRTSIIGEDEPVLRKGSPFLHDNVD